MKLSALKYLHTLRKSAGLLADAQLCNDRTVTLDVLLCEVVKQSAALTNHLVHTETAVVVVGMDLEVSGQLTDALSENGDLNFGRTGVGLVSSVFCDNVGLSLFGDNNDTPFNNISYPMTK